MKFQDIIIETSEVKVERDSDKSRLRSFKVRVVSSPEGEMAPDEAVTVRYNETDLRKQLDLLDKRQMDRDMLIKLGRLLGSLLLPPAQESGGSCVRELFSNSLDRVGHNEAGLRVRLRLSPELASAPWEYLYLDPVGGGDAMAGFLALDRRIALVRHEALPMSAPPPRVSGNITVLAALASPPYHDLDPLDLDREERDLRQALERPGVELKLLKGATLDEVQAAIRGMRIFHFAGHGAFRQQSGDEPGAVTGIGALAFNDAIVDAEKLGLNLQSNGVQLVVLGGCETGRRAGEYVWGSIAPALVRERVPAVVANQFSILDKCAIAFSRQFYRALVGGLPIECAVSAGRIAAYNTDQSGRDWGVPVLYLRAADGELFEGASDEQIRAAARRDAEEKRSVVSSMTGNVNVGYMTGGLVADIERQIVNGNYVNVQNIILLGPEALEPIAQLLMKTQKLEGRPMQTLQERVEKEQAAPENVRRQIRAVVAAQREMETGGAPVNPHTAYRLGMLAAYERDYETALNYFRQAAQADPEYNESFAAISWIQQSRALKQLNAGDTDAAVERLNEAREAVKHTDPLDGWMMALRGYISKTFAYVAELGGRNAERDKYYDEAVRQFEQAARLDPKGASAQNGLGNVQHARGNLDEAISAYQRAINLDPKYTAAYRDLAQAFEDKAKIEAKPSARRQYREKAIEAWREAYRLAPADPGFSADDVLDIGQHIEELSCQQDG